jgi:putative ABC transport system ATP-binding protein
VTVSSPSAIITTRDVCLTLPSAAGPVAILKDVTLTIPRGMAVAIVGPSGSGKSSLMAILSGLEQATSGRVEVDGADLAAMNEDALARFRRGRIGIILQSFHLVPTMTALENVAVPLELMGRRDAFSAARSELAAVGLGHRVDHYPAQLSGGEQQRVAIARALAPRPSLLFADEPTGNLDSATGAAIIELIFRLQDERAATLVMITHDATLAARADRIFTMSDGRVVAESSPTVAVGEGRGVAS